MRELFVETCTEQDEEGEQHSLDYYIVIDQMEVSGNFACESYGVKVARTGGGEEEVVPNITTSVSRIDELMGRLTRNFVSPSTLRDVVVDWL